MKPEEYIQQLKDAQRTLNRANEYLDCAIHRMQRRIETGNESMEWSSRLVALAGRDICKTVDSSIYEVATAKIEY